MDERLIVGLCNPGREYMGTRHNAGSLLLDRLIERYGATLDDEGGNYVLWRSERDKFRLFFMKPTTYMNLSGHALASFYQHHTLPLEQVLVVYDDVALPLGTIRARASGSAGGQKGMAHIIESVGTKAVPRLRIGIDSTTRGAMSLPDFVLSGFSQEEIPTFRQSLDDAEQAFDLWLEADMIKVMERFNKKAQTSDKNDELQVPINGGEN